MKTALTCRQHPLPDCCGLHLIHDLDIDVDDDPYNEIHLIKGRSTALMAITIPSQKEEIKRLRALKFKKLKSFRNPETGNMLTLWFISPPMQ